MRADNRGEGGVLALLALSLESARSERSRSFLVLLGHIFQTSTRTLGQIYIPQINWLLLIAVLALVLGFGSSSVLASAYGFAVIGTMTVTTVLAGAVALSSA